MSNSLSSILMKWRSLSVNFLLSPELNFNSFTSSYTLSTVSFAIYYLSASVFARENSYIRFIINRVKALPIIVTKEFSPLFAALFFELRDWMSSSST